jgi:hypothetical protein
MHLYTLAEIQHMAAIRTPLPAAYYDAAEVDAERNAKENVASEQDRKRTEEVYKETSEVEYQQWPLLEVEVAEARKKILAAALAQARREGWHEGVDKGFRDGVEAMRDEAVEIVERRAPAGEGGRPVSKLTVGQAGWSPDFKGTPGASPIIPQHLTEHPAYKAGYAAGTIRLAALVEAAGEMLVWLGSINPVCVEKLRAALAAVKEEA